MRPVSVIRKGQWKRLQFFEEWVLDDGQPTKEAQEIGYSLKPLTELFANRGVKEFGPLREKRDVKKRMAL